MIHCLTIENFRGLKSLTLEDLCPLTLISGKNNAGKSSILEAIFLMIDHQHPNSFWKLNDFRGLPDTLDQNSLWEPLFYNLNTDHSINISMQMDGSSAALSYMRDDSVFTSDNKSSQHSEYAGSYTSASKNSYSLKFTYSRDNYTEDGNFHIGQNGCSRTLQTNLSGNTLQDMPYVHYINTAVISHNTILAEWLGKLELEGRKQKVIEILQLLEPSVTGISTIAYRGQIQLYIKTGDKLLPLKLAGDGINKLLFIVLSILENPNSYILIDEIETGFHYSMYAKLWNVIAAAARESNCQIIATTHSYECIDRAIDGVEEADMLDNFCYYRVEKLDDVNHAYRYSGSLLRTAIATNMEVR